MGAVTLPLPSQIGYGFTSAQLAVLNVDQIAALEAADLAAIGVPVLATLSTAQIEAMGTARQMGIEVKG